MFQQKVLLSPGKCKHTHETYRFGDKKEKGMEVEDLGLLPHIC